MKVLLLPLLLALLLVAAAQATSVRQEAPLPTYFPPPCPRASPNFTDCIHANFQHVLPMFAKGEELFGLGPIDPLKARDVPSLRVQQSPFQFHADIIGMTVRGVSRAHVRGARAKLTDDALNMEFDMFFPTIDFLGNFKSRGSFGLTSFTGGGPWNISITDLAFTWRLIGKTVDVDGEKYMQLNRFFPIFSGARGLKAYSENLLDGAPELSNLVMAAVNYFWEPIMQSVLPRTDVEFERQAMPAANKVFRRIPYDQLFPPGDGLWSDYQRRS